MSSLFQTDSAINKTCERPLRWTFVGLLLLGVALRGYVSFAGLALLHNDEHQQYLEQANLIVYGYGQPCWEQKLGMRHLLYPALLALPLAGFEAMGIRDPVIQCGLLRFLVSLLALAACARFAWEFHRRGDSAAALLLLAAFAFVPDFVNAHSHPMSETAAMISFLLALVWVDRYPFAAGVLLGLSFGIRYQMGILVATVGILAWVRGGWRFNRPLLLLAGGLALVVIGLGLSDRIIYGGWFHSARAYVLGNESMIEANALPWNQYLIWWLEQGGWFVVVPLTVLLLIGACRETSIALLAAAFIGAHMIIGHKEARFLLPIAPLTAALVAVGCSAIGKQLPGRLSITALVIALIGMIAVSAARMEQIALRVEPYHSTGILLRHASRQADVCGVAVLGPVSALCGNYFFLRRDVPLRVVPGTTFEGFNGDKTPRPVKLNYLICRTELIESFAAQQPEWVASEDGWSLYRLGVPIDAEP